MHPLLAIGRSMDSAPVPVRLTNEWMQGNSKRRAPPSLSDRPLKERASRNWVVIAPCAMTRKRAHRNPRTLHHLRPATISIIPRLASTRRALKRWLGETCTSGAIRCAPMLTVPTCQHPITPSLDLNPPTCSPCVLRNVKAHSSDARLNVPRRHHRRCLQSMPELCRAAQPGNCYATRSLQCTTQWNHRSERAPPL